MSGSEDHEDGLTLAERRLDEHLELLRSDGLHRSPELVDRIVRAARRQRLIRQPLLVVTHFVATFGDGLRLLLGSHKRRS